MNDEIIIYVKRDEHMSIADIRSNFHISDFNGWEKVDEWKQGEDRYLYDHADNGEFIMKKHGKSLFDENGIPNFHDDFVVWTEEEKKEKYPRTNEKEKQEETLQTMMYQAQRALFLAELPDEEAATIPYCFDSYNDDPDGFPYIKDMRREYKGQLYKCLQNYKKEKDNPTQNPDVAVSLWVLTSAEEWPEWKQPTGSHDAYNTGDKVTHNGHKYTSNIDGNTTEPGTDDRWWTLV